MRGPVYIERENLAGDRCIVETLDVEGLPSGTDQMEYIKGRVHHVLSLRGSWRVRAIADDDRRDSMRILYTRTVR